MAVEDHLAVRAAVVISIQMIDATNAADEATMPAIVPNVDAARDVEDRVVAAHVHALVNCAPVQRATAVAAAETAIARETVTAEPGRRRRRSRPAVVLFHATVPNLPAGPRPAPGVGRALRVPRPDHAPDRTAATVRLIMTK